MLSHFSIFRAGKVDLGLTSAILRFMSDTNSHFDIDDSELRFDFVRSSGPGGQNVNKVATAVQLRFDIRNSPSLAFDVKERLTKLAGSKVTEEGVLVLVARRYRTQEQNRADAIQRLTTLINKASEPLPVRRATRPTRASKEVRLESKRRQGEKKQLRQNHKKEDLW